MSSGTSMSWRLLSPLAVLMWIVATVGFAATAQADRSTDPSDKQVSAQEANTAEDARAAQERAATQRAAQPSGDHAAGRAASGGQSGGTSGDVTGPQPISNADANSGGANGQCPDGPYCSTRDGSPSGNGNGDGKAVGEPCAGCVGKADNKNPRGQMPDASDHNAGYECDTNKGIAKTNPAHTGCKPPVVSPPPPPPPVCVESCVSPPVVSPPQGGPVPPQVPTAPRTLPETGATAGLVWLGAAALASILAGAGLSLGRRIRMDNA